MQVEHERRRATARLIAGAVVVALVSTLTWQAMKTYEARSRVELLQVMAQDALDLIVHDLGSRLKAMELLGTQISHGTELTEESFDRQAANFRNTMPGFFALAWVDPELRIRFTQPDRSKVFIGKPLAEMGADRLALGQDALQSRQPQISTAVTLRSSEDRGFIVAFPVQRDGATLGLIWAVFESRGWIDNLYFGKGTEYLENLNFVLSLDGGAIYRDAAYDQGARQVVNASLPFNQSEFILSAQPAAAFLMKQGDGQVALITGLVSILTSATLLAFFASRDARMAERAMAAVNARLAAANEAMKHEVAQRREAEEIAQKSNAAKSRFLSTMSHEMRTPMNAMLGMSELLSESPLDETQKGYVAALLRSGQRLMAIVTDLLDFSALETGPPSLSPKPASLREMLETAVSRVRPIAEKKSLELSVEIDPSLPEHALIDATRLGQAVLHILRNSVKFTDQGQIRLTASGTANSNGESTIEIAVADTGVGIAAEELEGIFLPFQQVEGDSDRRFEGAGIGLSLADRIIRAMGGEISVQSTPGRGSEFRITLPIQPLDLSALRAAPDAPALDFPAAGDSRNRPVRLLLAEDNLTNQKIVAGFLKDSLINLVVAGDGDEAVGLFGQDSFDAILMDVSMPKRNGFDAARMIREMEVSRGGRRCPIIGFTANSGAEDLSRCLEAGMDDVLSKPASKQELRKKLSEWIVA